MIAGLESTDHTRFSNSNTVFTVCDREESEARPFERCKRCNIVHHRKCLEPQPQPYGICLFLCDYPGCKEELDALLADPTLVLD